MHNGGAHLSFDIVADQRKVLVRETFRPDRIAGNKNGDVINESQARLQSATRIETSRFLGADREIVDHDFRRRIPQLGDDLLARRLLFQGQESAQRVVTAHMITKPVENDPHLYDGTRAAYF